MTAPLHTGFKPLRPGRIHLVCPNCGRKQSNMRRGQWDPPRAAIVVVRCEECSVGGFVDGPDDYLFKNGNPLHTCSECNLWIHEPGCSRRRGKGPTRV